MDYQAHFENIRINFDNLAQYEPHTWSHNARYLPGLLRTVDSSVGGMAVDVFCQRGDLARSVSKKFSKVIALDPSPEMIKVAKGKSEGYGNIVYDAANFLDYDIPDGSCGLITMVAALHHLPAEDTIRKAIRCLKPGGQLIIVDIFRPVTAMDTLSAIVSMPLNSIGLALFDKHKNSPEEAACWRVHTSLDYYDTIPKIRGYAGAMLPGAKIKRKLFWRYTLTWVKP